MWDRTFKKCDIVSTFTVSNHVLHSFYLSAHTKIHPRVVKSITYPGKKLRQHFTIVH